MKLFVLFLVALGAWSQSTPLNIGPLKLTRNDCTAGTAVVSSGKTGIQVSNSNGVTVIAVSASGQTSGITCANPLSTTTQANVVPLPNPIVTSGGLLTGITTTNLLPASACIGAGSATPENTFNYLCIYNPNNSNALIAQITFQYDTTPNVITLNTPSAGNKRINISVNDPKAGSANYSPKYEVCYVPTDATVIKILENTATDCPTSTPGILKQDFTSTSTSIVGLENGITYYFTVRVKGSEWSSVQKETPVSTDSFTGVYNGADNPFAFSCAQTSGGPATWMLLFGVFFFLRRRYKTPLPNPLPQGERGFLFAIVISLFSTNIYADLGQVNLGIIGTVYKPNLDASTKPDGGKAFPFYKCLYNDKLLPLMGLEVDWHLDDRFGSLQLGMGAAYTYASGMAVLQQTNGQPNCSQSADSVGLHMLHLRPQLTYILDPWIDEFPLLPYARTGLIVAGYLFTYQGGLDKERPAVKPMGFVLGWEAALGLMLSLSFLEPRVAKAAVANDVYERIYLKAEAAYMPINNFYQEGLNFSASWPTADFPLMLTFGLVFEFK